GDVNSSPAIGSDETIYVGSLDNYLYAINPDGTPKWKFSTGGDVDSSPAIGSDGTIYVGSGDYHLYALYSESIGLANSNWPKFHHDNQNTGRVLIIGPDIAVTPTSYDYGSVNLSAQICKDFVIKNEGTAQLLVNEIKLGGDDVSEFSISGEGSCPATPFCLEPGETCTIVVCFSPKSVNNKNATLSITSNDPNENPFDVPLSGKGEIPFLQDVITLDNAEGMPGAEVRIPLYIQDVNDTPLDADNANNKIAAWTLQFSADNEYYQITGVERVGITTGLTPYLEQFDNGNNTWTVIYNTSAGNPPPAFTLDKPAPGDLIGQLVVKIADTEVDEDTPVPVEIMSTTTMLSNETGTVGESVSGGTLQLVGGTLTILSFKCGDTNGDKVGPDFLDVVYLLNYVVGGGPPPDPLRAGNVNGMGGVDFLDVVYLLNSVVGGGPAPVCSDVTAVVASVDSQTKDVLTLGEINANAGETIRLPLYLQDVSGTPLDADDAINKIAAWTIRFSVDNEYYQITGVERAGITAGLKPYLEQFHDGNNAWTVIYNTSAGNPPPTFTLDKPAPGDLIGELVITLSDKAEGDLLVEISDATLSNEAGTVGEYLTDETLGVVAGTIHVRPLYGDVTGDGSVTALDAAVVLQACVGLVTLTPEQEEKADVSGKNGVTAYDAALILRYVVGSIEKFPVEGGLATPANNGQNYTLSVGRVSARANERIVVPISVDDANGILSGKLSLTYDATYLNPIDVKIRNRVFGKNSVSTVSKYNVRDGVLEFSFANSEELRDEVGQDGNHPSLFVEFEARNISTRTIPLTLSEAYLNEGLNTRKVDGWVKFIPETNALLNNFPNPFNPDTWIPYQLTESATVIIRIYNVSGQLVRILDIGHRQAGFYIDRVDAAYWDGCNGSGERVASGVYFYQLEAGKFFAVRKMTIIK
ncbi:choice-of-anchor D domain-containing protein, partial [Candidatus Poribacteria bacterium]|nr:choice-of-anchor D domain-containing protein [Candidatus Poribacteria bacterium]